MKKNVAALDGLRGLAACLVVLVHAQAVVPFLHFADAGYLAVDVFFALSGFVIASAYGRSLVDASSLRVFMVRRFGRIWPTMLAAFILYHGIANALVGMFDVVGHAGIAARLPSAADVFATITMMQGFGGMHVEPLVTWSASDEFYVYVLFGVVCLWTRGARRVAAFAALAAIGYAIAIWASVVPAHCMTNGGCFGVTHDWGWSRCIVGFFGGVLVAEHRNARAFLALRRPAAQVAMFVASVAFILAAPHVAPLALAAPVVFVALVASLTGDDGPVVAMLSGRVCQYLGSVSYPLYLAHAAVFTPFVAVAHFAHTWIGQTAALGFYVLLSLMLAQVLRDRIEQPYRERFRVWSMRFRGNGRASTAAM